PDHVILEGYEDKFELLEQISRKKNVKLSRTVRGSTGGIRNSIRVIAKKKVGHWVSKNAVAEKRKKRGSVTENPSEIFERLGSGFVAYLAPQSYRTAIYDPHNDQVRRGEHLVWRVLESVRSKRALLCIDVSTRRDEGMDILNERMQDSGLTWISLETIMN